MTNGMDPHDPAVDGELHGATDGTRIAFVSIRDADVGIYVMGADGSGVTRLTTDPDDDDEPAWSPDGTRIAFRSEREGNFEIYVVGVDG